MSDVKHTPGPWAWNGENTLVGQDYTTVLEAGDNGASYGMHTALIEHHWDKAVAEANRRLIAAAPCILAALEAMLVGSKYRETTIGGRALTGWATIRMPNEDALNLARAAIAKARGHD